MELLVWFILMGILWPWKWMALGVARFIVMVQDYMEEERGNG